eukprot:Colp12_sorted_trinity150504_noHs@21928
MPSTKDALNPIMGLFGGKAHNLKKEVAIDFDADEEFTLTGEGSAQDALFDAIVGHLEDIIMDDEFQSLQNNFMDKNCSVFEDAEENKLVYTEIFQNYTSSIENFIETKLKEREPGFSMDSFMGMIKARHDQVEGDVFDLLTSLGDFNEFKELMLSFKAHKEGRGFDMGNGFIVNSLGEL